MRAACKAYTTCRQELAILLTTGSHPNIVPLIGLCTRPLSLILHYAPMGSLEAVLKEYKRTNTQLGLSIYQKLVAQVEFVAHRVLSDRTTSVDRRCNCTFARASHHLSRSQIGEHPGVEYATATSAVQWTGAGEAVRFQHQSTSLPHR